MWIVERDQVTARSSSVCTTGMFDLEVSAFENGERSRIKIRIAAPRNVYGRFSDDPNNPHNSSFRLSRAAITKLTLGPMLRVLASKVEISCSAAGHSNCSGQNNVPRRNSSAVHPAVVAIVRTDCGAFEGDSSKQATRP